MSRHQSTTHIPGVSFSWRRAIGLSSLEGKIARETGIPFTKSGRQRKIGRIATHLMGWLFLAALAYGAYMVATHPELQRMLGQLIAMFHH